MSSIILGAIGDQKNLRTIASARQNQEQLKPQKTCHLPFFSLSCQAQFDPGFFFQEIGNMVVFFDGIITNKKELFSTLNLDPISIRSDLGLIYTGYKKWHINLAQYIAGHYQVIIWDIEQRQLFCVNSPFLTQPLYYCSNANGFYFSNFFPFFKEIFNDLKISPEVVGNYIMGNVIQNPTMVEMTCYHNIFRLPSGYQLLFKNNTLNTKKITNALITRSTQFSSREDTALAFRDCFAKAVKDYLPTQGLAGSQLSGGLDSSSTSLMAARLLKETNQRLTCFSAVPDPTFRFPAINNYNLNDTHLVESATKQAGNIDLQLIRCNKPVIKLQDLAKFCYHFCEAPAVNVMNITWISSIFQLANQLNIHTLLNGYFGNFTISFKGRHHRNILVNTLATLKKRLLSSSSTFSDRSLITSSFIKKNPIKIFDLPQSRDLTIQQLFSFIKPEHCPSAGVNHSLSTYFNIIELDPTTHPEVVSFCLNLPNNMYYYKGKSRYLIREAMQGILPEEIRLNTRSGTQCASWFYQLKEALPYYHALLPKFKKNDLINELIDVAQMGQLMNELSYYDPFMHNIAQTTLKFKSKLAKGLHIAEWIHLHDEPTPWDHQ